MGLRECSIVLADDPGEGGWARVAFLVSPEAQDRLYRGLTDRRFHGAWREVLGGVEAAVAAGDDGLDPRRVYRNN